LNFGISTAWVIPRSGHNRFLPYPALFMIH
jgi:hypothetical protein